jgi:hypothetical protein
MYFVNVLCPLLSGGIYNSKSQSPRGSACLAYHNKDRDDRITSERRAHGNVTESFKARLIFTNFKEIFTGSPGELDRSIGKLHGTLFVI